MLKTSDIKNLDTPFFYFCKDTLQAEVSSLKKAIEQFWTNSQINYSFKTNSFPPLAKYLKELGINVEVVSQDEYELVSKVGYSSKEIICNGPVKSQDWVTTILDNEVALNIDSEREIDYVSSYARAHSEKTIEIGLRVNIDIDSEFPCDLGGDAKGSRFGFCYENGHLRSVINRLKELSNIKIRGLHMHIASKSRSIEKYRWIIKMFSQIVKQYGLADVNFCDVGGGFYGGVPTKPSWNDYLKAMAEELKSCGYSSNNLKLILEPGISLLAGCFSYYARVIDTKENMYQKLVLIDGSRMHIDPLMNKQNPYFFEITGKDKLPKKTIENGFDQQLVGFTCIERDRFFNLKSHPLLEEGDVIRFDKMGAYTIGSSPLFISFFPAVYSKDALGKIECLRAKWTAEQVIQLSKV